MVSPLVCSTSACVVFAKCEFTGEDPHTEDPRQRDKFKHVFGAPMPNIYIHSDPKTSQSISWQVKENKHCNFS